MGLKEIDPEKYEQEQKITQRLFELVDEGKSLVFDAGAGAGKTYALAESLRHVIRKYGKKLERHNQKIMCITYTNVAANNIKAKIGNSNLVIVSTIHERLWQLIKSYQRELLVLHRENMENIVADDRAELTDENTRNAKIYRVYRELMPALREAFEEDVCAHKEEFYQGYTMSADDFRKHYGDYVAQYPNVMSNVGNFRAIVSKVYEIKRFEACLSEIEDGKLKEINYNAMYNRDRLDKMRISHDTLLEYGKKLILKYPVLQQIIFDQFPYIFIDEYQDTSSEVVEIMAALDTHAKEMKRKFFVGYYGDRVQNIYDDGIGCHLLEKHENLERISKEFNRRSYKEIIDVANRIRLDDLHQISIYKDCIGGSVEFCDMASVETVIERYRNEKNYIIGEKVHCFVLKNEEVAKRLGISNLYNVFKNSRAYSNVRFQQLNTELLSTDKEKLGEAASFLYRVLEFYTDVRWEGTPVEKILYGDIKDYHDLNIAELKNIKKCLQGIEGDTLELFLMKMCECYKKGSNNIRTIIKAVLDLEEITDNYITGYFMQTLEQKNMQENEEEDENESVGRIRQLYSIRMEELEKWHDYIKRKENTDIIYHTFHGTKGLEFENVIIVLEDGFGTKREDKVFIKIFLENYSELSSEKQV